MPDALDAPSGRFSSGTVPAHPPVRPTPERRRCAGRQRFIPNGAALNKLPHLAITYRRPPIARFSIGTDVTDAGKSNVGAGHQGLLTRHQR